MKNILILGGTRFFGRKLVEYLIDEGHHVTIITRGGSGNPFGEKVEHIIADRSNKEELSQKVEGRNFDIVYDNICYSPNDAYAFCEVFNGKIGKLVFTSTLSVYDIDGQVKREADFDPYHYEIIMGDSADFSYGEGKRLAEAVFFNYAKFPVVAMRIPIVLGVDDYTRRLHFHVEHISNGMPISFVNMDAEMGFIQAKEAARFLQWAGMTDVEGPYNAAADGKVSLADLVKMIEEVTGKRADINFEKDEKSLSPYAVPQSWYMNTEKAKNQGFQFSNLHDWLKPLVVEISNSQKN